MADIATLVMAVACWLAFGYKLRHLRQRSAQPNSAPLRVLVWVLGLSGALATMTPVAVGQAVDSLVGVSGVTRLLANILSMATCLAIAGWLLHLGLPEPEARRRLSFHIKVFAVVLVLILVLFAVHHPPLTPDRLFAGVYTYVFLAYVTYVVIAQIVISWRYAKVVAAPMLRLGLRLVAASNVLGIGAIMVAAVNMLAHDLAIAGTGSSRLFFALYAISSTLFVVGLTLPAWGPRVGLETMWWGIARRFATRDLSHLWTVVTEAYPGVILDRELLAASPNGRRLIAERMPVEIHDGWLQLRHYLTQADIDAMDRLAERQRLRDRDRDALLAAARLMVAIGRQRDASQPTPGGAVAPSQLRAGTDGSLLADVRFLCATSRRLRSPVRTGSRSTVGVGRSRSVGIVTTLWDRSLPTQH